MSLRPLGGQAATWYWLHSSVAMNLKLLREPLVSPPTPHWAPTRLDVGMREEQQLSWCLGGPHIHLAWILSPSCSCLFSLFWLTPPKCSSDIVEFYSIWGLENVVQVPIQHLNLGNLRWVFTFCLTTSKKVFSAGVIWIPQGHLVTESGDIFWLSWLGRMAIGTQRVETILQCTGKSPTKNYLALKSIVLRSRDSSWG